MLLVGCLTLLSAMGQVQPKKEASKQDKKSVRRDRINSMLRQEEEGELVFHRQSVWGIKLSTDGYGFSYELGKFMSNRKSILFQVEFDEKKHPKEKKVSLFDGFGFSNIIFGKANNFYQLRLGVMLQNRIGGKGNKNGVAVAGIVGGGVSIGLVKPYLVDVRDNNDQQVRKQYPEIADSGYAIVGAAGFTKGWENVKINPGAYIKAGMRFDYGRFNETITAIETGLRAEFYSKKVEQMAYIKQKQFFFSAYVALLLGRRK